MKEQSCMAYNSSYLQTSTTTSYKQHHHFFFNRFIIIIIISYKNPSISNKTSPSSSTKTITTTTTTNTSSFYYYLPSSGLYSHSTFSTAKTRLLTPSYHHLMKSSPSKISNVIIVIHRHSSSPSHKTFAINRSGSAAQHQQQ